MSATADTSSLRTFKSSALSRNSPEVFAAAEKHPVDVTRRDGEDLVLMSKREAAQRQTLLELAAQMITIATDDHGTLAERMSSTFPWMLALSETDRAQCAWDLLDAARASLSTGQSHLANAEFSSWRETAVAIAAGFRDESVDWYPEDVPVDRP
jgi:hypothetical protein